MSLSNMGLGFTVTAQDTASSILAKISKQLDDVEKSAKGAGTALGAATGKAAGGRSGGAAGASAGMNKAATSAAGMRTEIGGAANEMKSIGKSMMLFGGAGVAGLGLAVDAAGHFGQKITEVGTLVDHGQFSVEEMEKVAKQMAQTYGGDVDTQIKALYQAISSGADTAAKSTNFLQAANELAIAGATDQATAITGLSKVLNNYNMDFSKAREVSDAFFVAVKDAQTTVGELGHSIGEVAASAKSAGISYTDLIAALGTAATLTRDTAGATAGLKAALSNIAHPTAEATKEAAKLGVKFDAVTLRSKGLKGFLDGITGSSKFSADSMSHLFGSLEAANVITALTANSGEKLAAAIKDMGNRAGGAKAAFDEMNGQLDQQKAVMKANFMIALIELGRPLLPIVQKITSGISSMLAAFSDLPAPVKQVITYLILGGSAGLLLAGVVVTLAGVIAGLAVVAKPVLIGLAATVGLLQYVAVAAGVAAIAVAGFKTVIDKNVGSAATFIAETASKLKLTWQALSQVFSQGGFSGAVREELNKAENGGIKAFAIQVYMWFGRIETFFKSVVSGFQGVVGGMDGPITGLIDALKGLGAAFGIVQDKPDEAKGKFAAFGAAGTQLGYMLAEAFKMIVFAITKAAIFVTWFKKGIDAVEPVISSLVSTGKVVIETFKGVFDSITNIGGATGGPSSGIASFAAAVGFAAKLILMAIGQIIRAFTTSLEAIGGFIRGIILMVSGIFTVFEGVITFFKGLFTGNLSVAFHGIKLIIFGFVKFLIGTITGGLLAITSAIDGIGKRFGKNLGFSDAIRDVQNQGLDALAKGLGLDQGPKTGQTPEEIARDKAALNRSYGSGNIVAGPSPAVAQVAAASAAPSTPLAPVLATPDVNLNQNIALQVDGAVLAEVANKEKRANETRSFGPFRPPR